MEKRNTKPRRKRNKLLICYFSEQEVTEVQRKMECAGYASFSAYARAMLLEGKVNRIDFSELKTLNRELGHISGSLNQIAKVANTTHDLHEDDYQDVVNRWNNALELVDRYLYRVLHTRGDAYLRYQETKHSHGSHKNQSH